MAFEPGKNGQIRQVSFDQQKWTECRKLAPGARQRGEVIYDIVSSSQICVGFGELTGERRIPALILKKARALAADIVTADQLTSARVSVVSAPVGAANASGKRPRKRRVYSSSSSSSADDDSSCSSSSASEMLAGRLPAKRVGGGRAR